MRRVLSALVLVCALAVALPALAGADGSTENEPPASTSPESEAAPDDPCPIDENGNCLPDRDRDGRGDEADNCPDHWNPGQEDNDADGLGNVCDPTPEGDPPDDDDDDDSPPPGGCTSTAPVILYEHVDFGGACWGFAPGSHSWLGDYANDKASSIRVAAGYVVSLFPHPDFGGSWHNTETSASPWGWSNVGNDSVSSLVVQTSALDPNLYEGDELNEPDGIGSSPATSGCARVGDAVRFKNRERSRTLWTYALRVSFCWNGMTITSLWGRDIVVDIPPLPFPFSLISSWTYTQVFFLEGEAGHPSTTLRVNGKFEYCSFHYGCGNARHPWIAMELRGNGSAMCTSSVARVPRACFRGKA